VEFGRNTALEQWVHREACWLRWHEVGVEAGPTSGLERGGGPSCRLKLSSCQECSKVVRTLPERAASCVTPSPEAVEHCCLRGQPQLYVYGPAGGPAAGALDPVSFRLSPILALRHPCYPGFS
jgi:hypothetical protein